MRAIKLFLLLLISFNFFGCKEDAKVVEEAKKEIKETPKAPEKSARERLKDKGLM